MLFDYTASEIILFFILYGITGMAAFIAAVYLLLRKGNAFAADITPPSRLRRWAASFFGLSALSRVWWYLFVIRFDDINSEDDILRSSAYIVVVVLDFTMLLITLSGTLLAMLQDRKRSVLPVFLSMVPFAVLGAMVVVRPSVFLMHIGFAYVLLLFIAFTVYIFFSVRQYGRWLRDNYADLERKEVWLSLVAALACMLLFIFYVLADASLVLMYILHILYLVFYTLLLWRVETLPQLGGPVQSEQTPPQSSNANVSNIEQLLAEHCVATQLYLQHDLTLTELAKALGTNRTYLGQYFSSKHITYNAYVNNLRIDYFTNRYKEVVRNRQSFTIQQLAHQSGYRSYSTFSLAFKHRMGRSVTDWIRNVAS